MVWEAYQKVKSNKGSAGVDGVSLAAFELGLEKHLYKIWNRLTSGSYYPQAVREVEIPKKDGRVRKLGIPTESDRIAQQVIKSYLEPRLEKVFHTSSYGYRPKCSAHQAIEAVRANVRKYAWVIDMDIKGFFDEMDHELLLKAVEKHAEEKWVRMYIRRWLEMPIEDRAGHLYPKEGKGTPQGGVITLRTHPQTLSLLNGLRLKEGSFRFFIKSIIFMIHEKITEFGISRKNQSGIYLIGATEAADKYCRAVNEHLWCISNTGLSLCSASQREQRTDCYSGEFSGFYCKTSTQSDSSGKGICSLPGDFHQQNSQSGAGRVFIQKTALWPKRRRLLKYRSPMIACASKNSHKPTIFSFQASQSSYPPQVLFINP
jgi:hypothetical protein